jgi:6-phosphogluconolactonase
MALLTVARDESELAERVAERLVATVTPAARDGEVHVVLTGGRTPKRLYELLASPSWRSRLPWDRAHLYWSDERHVPPDHPDSNYGMTREALLRPLAIPDAQVHRIQGELAADDAARRYEEELPPRFVVMLLGMGEDGHIASVFPGSPLLADAPGRAAAVWAPHLHAWRITLTPRELVAPAHVLMVVAGSAKAAAVAAAFDARVPAERCPARLLAGAGDRVEWFIDRAAAKDVSSPPT